MGDSIYIVEPGSHEPFRVNSVKFTDLNVAERSDLEKWVIRHPDILGEPLLIVTSEFDRFDKSSRRLDVLALDEKGTLVVVELKLDASGSLADQQAIRYAAFCSTMGMSDVVNMLSRHSECSADDATAKIIEFLSTDDLPELQGEPRIILAAGSIDDQELTSTVLWLRKFGVDITCVELTPFRIPSSEQVVLVPRVIIPLPETRRYQIGVERKAVARIREAKDASSMSEVWEAIIVEFNALHPLFSASSSPPEAHTNPSALASPTSITNGRCVAETDF